MTLMSLIKLNFAFKKTCKKIFLAHILFIVVFKFNKLKNIYVLIYGISFKNYYFLGYCNFGIMIFRDSDFQDSDFGILYFGISSFRISYRIRLSHQFINFKRKA